MTDHQIITKTGYYCFAKSGLHKVTHKESEEMKAWREEELRKRTKDEERRVIAMKLLELGISVDDIVNSTGLRKASVEKMKRELRK